MTLVTFRSIQCVTTHLNDEISAIGLNTEKTSKFTHVVKTQPRNCEMHIAQGDHKITYDVFMVFIAHNNNYYEHESSTATTDDHAVIVVCQS